MLGGQMSNIRNPLCAAVLLGVALCGVLPGSAAAQETRWGLWLGGGPSVPLADLADEAVTGFHAQVSVEYDNSRLPVALRMDGFFQDMRNVDREPGLYVSLGGEWFRQLGLILNAVRRFGGETVRPYGLAGVGYVREWHEDRTWFGTKHAVFNVVAGLGTEVGLFGRTGFVEARYMNSIGGDPLPLRPPAVLSEVRFQSVALTLGIRF